MVSQPRQVSSLGVLILAVVVTAGCSGNDSNPTGPILPFSPFSQQDLNIGTGAEAVVGTRVTVNYTGWLYDPAQPENKGQQFDSSEGRPPFTFTVGAGQVIRGWDQGIPGMKVGGQRRLTIPFVKSVLAKLPGGSPASRPLVDAPKSCVW